MPPSVLPTPSFSSVDRPQGDLSFPQIKSPEESTIGIMRNLHQGKQGDVPRVMGQVPKAASSPKAMESSRMNLADSAEDSNNQNKKKQESKNVYTSVESKSESHPSVNYTKGIVSSVIRSSKPKTKKPLPIVNPPSQPYSSGPGMSHT